MLNNHPFTKTGSGQTQGKLEKGRVSAGDELSCTCGVPFWAVDTATSYFRGVLGEQDGLIHYTNECMSQ